MAKGDLKQRVGKWTVANQLTFLRLVAIPFFILAVLDGRFGLAFWLFVGAGITDVLDGAIARILKQRSPLGATLDPLADKLLLTAGFVLLTEYPHMFRDIAMANRIPVWLTTLVLSRDLLIVLVAVLLHVTYQRTKFRPTLLGKLTTLSEIVTVSVVLFFNRAGHEALSVTIGVWVTLLLVVVSGVDYLVRTVRHVRDEDISTPSAQV